MQTEAQKRDQDNDYIQYRLVEQTSHYKRFAAFKGTSPVSIAQWANTVLLTSPRFKDNEHECPSHLDHIELQHFVKVLKEATVEYKAYFFETKGVSRDTTMKQFEFVVVESKDLYDFGARGVDLQAFDEHFHDTKKEDKDSCGYSETTVSFSNISGSSMLVAPKPLQKFKDSYTHLANFLRMAPELEVANFWYLTGQKYASAMQNEGPVWLSTSGTGIAYLHMRFDGTPKYYTYKPFKTEF